MTGYELRRHLETDHHIPTRGLDYGHMTALHQDDHHGGADHTHGEAGHLGQIPDLLYVIILFLFILVLLRALRLI